MCSDSGLCDEQEEQKWLAEEKVREIIEERDDVVKRGHMGDFYRCVGLAGAVSPAASLLSESVRPAGT